MKPAIVIAFLLSAGVARADELAVEAPASPPAWQIHASTTWRWFTDSSAVTLAEGPLNSGGASIERRLATVSLPGPFDALDLTAELGFDAGATSGTTFQQLASDISMWEIDAGARARLPLTSWLHVTGRAGVGGGRTYVSIREMTTASGISDEATRFGAHGALGLALLPRLTSAAQAGVFLGLDLEVGYRTGTAMSVTAIPEDRPAPELTIPAAYASLGDLDLDGWTLRLGTSIGF